MVRFANEPSMSKSLLGLIQHIFFKDLYICINCKHVYIHFYINIIIKYLREINVSLIEHNSSPKITCSLLTE